jgi:hypothetical protein
LQQTSVQTDLMAFWAFSGYTPNVPRWSLSSTSIRLVGSALLAKKFCFPFHVEMKLLNSALFPYPRTTTPFFVGHRLVNRVGDGDGNDDRSGEWILSHDHAIINILTTS